MTAHSAHLIEGLRDPGIVLYFEQSSTVYHQGDEAKSWYEIIRGTVRTCLFTQEGDRQITAFYYDGDVFGIDNDFYSETVEAVTDLVVRCRKKCAISPAPAENEEATDLPHLLRRTLGAVRQSVLLLGRKTALQRVAAFILALPPSSASSTRRLPMSRADIGDHLGLTLHTISRTMAELARRRLVSFSTRQVTILDARGLRELAGGEPAKTGDEPQTVSAAPTAQAPQLVDFV